MIYTFIAAVGFHVDIELAAQYCAPTRMDPVVGRWVCCEQALGTKSQCVTDVDHQHAIGSLHQPPQVRREKGLPVFVRGVA